MTEAKRAHDWLRSKVGVTHLAVGSDSAGGNVTLQMLSLLSGSERASLKGSIWFSPFLELSITFPTEAIVTQNGLKFDVLTRPVVTSTANHTVFGHDDNPKLHDYHEAKKLPENSPFYQCDATLLVPPRPLIIYSQVEMFGPAIAVWVDRLGRISSTTPIRTIVSPNMPHDFPLLGSLIPIGDIGNASLRTGKRVADVLDEWMLMDGVQDV